jgi:hypothetical protein
MTFFGVKGSTKQSAVASTGVTLGIVEGERSGH